MHSHEALQRAIHGSTVQFAKRLGLSTSLVNKWQEPTNDWTDSGVYNPLDRIEAVVEMALSQGRDEKDALAPIHYLARRFGLISIKIPEYNKNDLGDLTHELMDTITEFGQLTEATSAAIADGRISCNEAKRIEKEAWELIHQVTVFMARVREAVR